MLPVFALCAVLVAAGCGSTEGKPMVESASSTPAATASSSAPAPSASPTIVAAPPSDEQQIRAAIKGFQDAANSQNWDAYLQAMCPSMRATFTPSIMDRVKSDRAAHGITTLAVQGVTITGDTATAQLDSTNELIGSMQVSLRLARGEDGWKVCVG
jgi:hypothetical protein